MIPPPFRDPVSFTCRVIIKTNSCSIHIYVTFDYFLLCSFIIIIIIIIIIRPGLLTLGIFTTEGI